MDSLYHDPDLRGDKNEGATGKDKWRKSSQDNSRPQHRDGEDELEESAAQFLREFKQHLDELSDYLAEEEVQRGLNKAAFDLEPFDEVCCLGGWYGMWAFKIFPQPDNYYQPRGPS